MSDNHPVTNRWVGLTIDCTDPERLASFWGAVLDIAPSTEHGEDRGWTSLGTRNGDQPRLTFQRVPEVKTSKVRLHLDVEVDDIDSARSQVESLGGSWSGERHDYDEGVVLVMLDPEGHEFCLVQFYD
ncbi:Glyoxalase-like domain protein [Mycobacteroides franklinii]|uniref:Glyoxalase-like domain protein n=1 Tax=Mycobacteroides franklinii TaxID=948102 RepID=A0A4R8R752_9MYCO|nr:Glyoxalase-like domain protein [Mycobacteroides franklinii]TDZ52045.1 Glyoxalase-like domain protein [Mycobacteroides franklinii]TDZ55452.1 Glyoxalase-like domain protein [Mycobacteroides franklinii]TDZ62393.1 Glyoxalase-like domain protein [Mycobacteroides franklinii]TDZ68790.1 Glyoxalase-like domain protein [Mycobacteroides franklinii]